MCDNPDKDPWKVVVNPMLIHRIFPGMLDMVLDRGLESEIPALKGMSKEDLFALSKGVEAKREAMDKPAESSLAHIEFDVKKLKELSEKELRELLGKKLIPRIIEDIKELEINRPIPDWCYAFF